ncbi:MAG: hypothetical protein AAFR59_05090, partial [Bacteroidota bacterium]
IRYVVINLFLVSFCLSLSAQKLSLTEIDLPLSKNATKAAKKGALLNGGSFLSTDGKTQYSFYLYQPKGASMMYDVIGVDISSGKVTSSQTEAYTMDNLAKYDLYVQDEIVEAEDASSDLGGREFGFFRRPGLAGPPTLVKGKFENKYVNAVWAGYKFKKGEGEKLAESFWPDFSFAIEEGVSNQNYLLRKRMTLGRLLFGGRNYIPMDGKAYVGGLMAVSGVNMFLTGIFDMESMTWDHKGESELEPGLTFLDHVRRENGHVICLMSSKSSYFLVEFDGRGNKINKLNLSIPHTRNYAYTTFDLYEATDAIFVIGSHLDKPNTGMKAGLSITKVQNRQEVFHVMHDFAAIQGSIQAAPKNKAKFKASMNQQIESIEQLANGDYLLIYNSGIVPFHNYALQMSPQGKLKVTYQVDAIENDGSPNTRLGNGSTHLPTLLLEAGDAYYMVIRTVPQSLEKGVQVDESTSDLGSLKLTTTRTVRIDELYCYGKIVKINPAKQTISNVLEPDQILAGEIPGEVTPNGDLILHTLDNKKKKRVKLMVQ